MTLEEMAKELRKAGWRIQEPLTQENCKHPRLRGSGMVNSDGSSHSESYCPDCGKSWTFDGAAQPQQLIISQN